MTKKESRLFAYSLRFTTWGLFIAGLLFLLMAIRYLLFVQDGFIGAIIATPFCLVFFYGFAKYWRVKISRAFFFEDHFEIHTRGAREDFRYEDVRKVEIAPQKTFWTPFPHVTIYLRQERSPLVLIASPRSKSLNTDLYSWLVRKLAS